jgi:hypothetical protein
MIANEQMVAMAIDGGVRHEVVQMRARIRPNT